MPRKAALPSINETVVPVGLFAPDPRGLGMFQALSGMQQRGLSGHIGTVVWGEKKADGHAFNGTFKWSPQHFAGLAPLSAGGARAIPDRIAGGDFQQQLSDGPVNDSAMRIFAERLRRGRS